MDQQSLEDTGRALSTIWPWLKVNYGPDGFLIPAAALAASDPDLIRRQQTLGQIDSQQLLVSGQIPDPDHIYNVAAINGLVSPQEAARAAYFAALLKGFPTEVADTIYQRLLSKQFTREEVEHDSTPTALDTQIINFVKTIPTSAENPIANFASMAGSFLGAAFFDLPRKALEFTTGLPFRATEMGLSAIGAEGVAENVAGVRKIAEHVVGEPIGLAKTASTEVFGRAFDVATGATLGLLGSAERAARGEDTADYWRRYIWPEHAGEGVGRAFADAAGKRPTDSNYEEWVAFGSLVIPLVAGKFVIGQPFAALKSVGITPVAEAGFEAFGRLNPEELAANRVRYGPLGGVIRTAYGKTWEDFLASGKADTFSRDVWRVIEKTRAEGGESGGIQQAFRNIPTTVADRLGESRGPHEVLNIFEKTVKNFDPIGRERDAVRLGEIKARLSPGEALGPDEFYSLSAEKAVLEMRLSRPAPEPMWEFPKTSAVRRVARGMAFSRVGDDLSRVLNPVGWIGSHLPVPHITRLFDQLYDSIIWRPGGRGVPPDTPTRNAKYLMEVGRRAGVKPSKIRELVSRMNTAARDDVAWERWANDVETEIRASHLISPDRKMDFGYYSSSTPSERVRSVVRTTKEVNGQTIIDWEPVLQRPKELSDGTVKLAPAIDMSAHTLDGFRLPSIHSLIDSSSWTRRQMRRIRKSGAIGKTVLLPYDAASFVARASTAVLKPLALTAGGLRVPALIMRIEGEQVGRTKGMGFKAFPELSDRRPLDMFSLADLKPRDLGSLTLADMTTPGLEETWITQPLRGHYSMSGRLPPPEAWRSIRYRLQSAHASPEIRELLARGPDRWVEWLSGEGKDWLPTIQARIKDTVNSDYSPTTIKDYAQREYQSHRELAGGDQALVDAMVGGTWFRRGSEAMQKVDEGLREKVGEQHPVLPNASELITEYEHRVSDDLLLRQSIQAADSKAGRAAARVLHKENVDRIVEIERMAGVKNLKRAGVVVNLRDDFAVDRALEQHFARGDYELPVAVSGPKWVLKEEFNPDYMGVKWLDFLNRKLYAPFRTVSKVDVRLTRGRLYQQAARDSYDYLIRMGYPKSYAKEFAVARGSQITRDIMFDLGTKSSAHMFLKNVFWFAPAFQEIIETWAVKIPSRYYWPVGAAYLYDKAHRFSELLKMMGVVHKDADNRDVIWSPFAALANKFHLTPVPVMLGWSPESFNLATAGGFAPSLSWAGNVGLGYLTRRYGGVFKSLSDVFQPYGTEPRIGPAAIGHLYTAMTGDMPPWERLLYPDLQNNLWQKGRIFALQQAYAEHAGDEPRPENFPTDTAYQTAHRAWLNTVMGEAGRLHRIHAALQLFGATVTPASWQLTDVDQQAASKVMSKLYGPRPTEGTEAYVKWYAETQQVVDTYLQDYPGGAAYLVPTTIRDFPKRRLPYVETDPIKKYYADLYTGAKKVLSPDDFMARVQVWESSRFYQAAQERALATLGDTAAERLRNYGRVKDTINAAKASWDRYRILTPEVDSYLDELRGKPNTYGTGPLPFDVSNTLAAYRALGELKDVFTVDGRVSADWKAVRAGLIQSALPSLGPLTARTQIEKNVSWFINSFVIPFGDEVNPLYTKAKELLNSGDRTGAGVYFDRIAEIKEGYNQKISGTKGPDGQTYPTLDEYQWGLLTPTEQADRRYKWGTSPLSWLSGFEAEQAGYKLTPALREFVAGLGKFNDSFYAYVQRNGISTQSNAYDQLDQDRLRQIAASARKVGPEAIKLAALNEATPFERLGYLNLANSAPQSVRQAWEFTVNTIRSKGLSIKGWSELALDVKRWFFDGLDELRDPASPRYDFKFDNWMTQMGFAIHARGTDTREGVSLYNALFFGGFDDRFIPTEAFGDRAFLKASDALLAQAQRAGTINGVPLLVSGGVILRQDAMESFLAAEKRLGLPIRVTSSFRTGEEQARIYFSGIRPAAPPGHSLHEQGLALDVAGSFLAAHPEVRDLLLSMGWHQFDPVGDAGHFSFGVTG
jgi:hypothetical protein